MSSETDGVGEDNRVHAVVNVSGALGGSDRLHTLRLSNWEKVSYGLGDFAGGLCWNAVGAFLLYYYNNVALLPAAAVGTLFLVSRLLDAGIDLGIGVFVDKTRSRWGRTRPWLMLAVGPFCVFMVLTFITPSTSADFKLAYAYVTFIILGVLYSLVAVPYSALMPLMTNVVADRMQLGSARAVGTSASVIVATVATMPLVGLFGRGDEQRRFTLVMLVFAALTLLMISNLVLNLVLNYRERHYDDKPPDFQIAPAVRDMFRNRAWLVTFVFTVLNFVRFGAVLSVTAFFAIEVLRKPWMISVLLPAGFRNPAARCLHRTAATAPHGHSKRLYRGVGGLDPALPFVADVGGLDPRLPDRLPGGFDPR